MNKVCLIGRLTAKPELRYTSNNKAVCNFSIAVNRNYKNEDGELEVDFINCSVFEKMAENIAKYQEKGNLIAVEGSLRIDIYDDKDGNKVRSPKVQVSNIEYLQSKSKEEVKQEKVEADDPFAEFGQQIEIEDNFLD